MFRDKLRTTRESRNITQIDMAGRLGIAVTTYRNYENTSREPNYDILVNISKILGVTVDYLLGNENKNSINESILTRIQSLSSASINELSSYIDYLYYKENK